jgi:hypothetical protein
LAEKIKQHRRPRPRVILKSSDLSGSGDLLEPSPEKTKTADGKNYTAQLSPP